MKTRVTELLGNRVSDYTRGVWHGLQKITLQQACQRQAD